MMKASSLLLACMIGLAPIVGERQKKVIGKHHRASKDVKARRKRSRRR